MPGMNDEEGYADEETRGGSGFIESKIPEGHSGGNIQKMFGYTQLGLQ